MAFWGRAGDRQKGRVLSTIELYYTETCGEILTHTDHLLIWLVTLTTKHTCWPDPWCFVIWGNQRHTRTLQNSLSHVDGRVCVFLWSLQMLIFCLLVKRWVWHTNASEWRFCHLCLLFSIKLAVCLGRLQLIFFYPDNTPKQLQSCLNYFYDILERNDWYNSVISYLLLIHIVKAWLYILLVTNLTNYVTLILITINRWIIFKYK